jgi:hypothetical protein
MTSNSDSPRMSSKSSSELTPPMTARASSQAPMIINGRVVPTGPRALRATTTDDPFVTPPRGIGSGPSTPAREPLTTTGSMAEGNATPTASGFTPRADRLAEPITAENAQAIFLPQACVFVAK